MSGPKIPSMSDLLKSVLNPEGQLYGALKASGVIAGDGYDPGDLMGAIDRSAARAGLRVLDSSADSRLLADPREDHAVVFMRGGQMVCFGLNRFVYVSHRLEQTVESMRQSAARHGVDVRLREMKDGRYSIAVLHELEEATAATLTPALLAKELHSMTGLVAGLDDLTRKFV